MGLNTTSVQPFYYLHLAPQAPFCMATPLACNPNHHTSFIYFYYFFVFWYQSLIFENFKFQFQFPKLQFLNLMFKTLILKSFSKFQFLSNLISKTPILKSFSKFQFLSNLISKIPIFFLKKFNSNFQNFDFFQN